MLLRADNRPLIKDTKYSYLLNNSLSGDNFIIVANTANFYKNSFVIIGSVGSENTELVQIDTVTSSNGKLTFVNSATLKFAHAESTRVTVIGYDKVRFFWTPSPITPNQVPYSTLVSEQNVSQTDVVVSTITAPQTSTYTDPGDPGFVHTVDVTPPIVFDNAIPLTNPIDLQLDDSFSSYEDDAHPEGYGWFAFYNSTTAAYSPISNSIPYGGFEPNTVKSLFDGFDSCLNSKELKLISTSDRFAWANEAFSYMTNELNLGNWEYNSSNEIELKIYSSIYQYLLPRDFSNLLYINDGDGNKMDSYSATFQKPHSPSLTRYLIRGKYIVFDPKPTAQTSFTLAYLRSSSKLSDLSDVVDLPDNAYYYIKDYMLFRAYNKLGNPSQAKINYDIFTKAVENMKIYAIKRDDGLDSWTISPSANV